MTPEMHSMLLNQKIAKEAVKMMRLKAECVKEVNAQKLLVEFKSIVFKLGETINDFAFYITTLTIDLCGLGENSIDDTHVVKNFL
jgi:hypothetical protein